MFGLFKKKPPVENEIPQLKKYLFAINLKLNRLIKGEKILMANIDQILASVQELGSLQDSVVTSVEDLKAQVEKAKAEAEALASVPAPEPVVVEQIPADVQAKMDNVFDTVEALKAKLVGVASAPVAEPVVEEQPAPVVEEPAAPDSGVGEVNTAEAPAEPATGEAEVTEESGVPEGLPAPERVY